MAKEFAKQFYSSKAWQDTRDAYYKSQKGLCENCLKNGIVSPGEIVHHKVFIDAVNIDNPNITLNHDNLELLCRKCHGALHNKKRFSIGKNGEVIPLV